MAREIFLYPSSFRELRTKNQLYIDKTGLIREWWEQGPPVFLGGPGGTLFLDTIETFFSIKEPKDQAELFSGLAILEGDKSMLNHAGRYPVIRLDFSDLASENSETFITGFVRILGQAFRRFPELAHSEKLSEEDRVRFAEISAWEDKADGIYMPDEQNARIIAEAPSALRTLCRLLVAHYGAGPIVLADELFEPYVESPWKHFMPAVAYFFEKLIQDSLIDNPFPQKTLATGWSSGRLTCCCGFLEGLPFPKGLTEFWCRAVMFSADDIKEIVAEYGLSEKEISGFLTLSSAAAKRRYAPRRILGDLRYLLNVRSCGEY